MDPLYLIRQHLALEGTGIDLAGQLVRTPCPDPDTLFRVYVTRHELGETVFFQAGLAQPLREKLLRLPTQDFFDHPERVKAILAQEAPCLEHHIGKSYVFPDTLHSSQYPDVVQLSQVDPAIVRLFSPGLDPRQEEIFCILADGIIVATCESSREDQHSGEAWVQTLEPYRRRGYARQVTAAWGYALQQLGKTPFYSHRWENLASQAVARSLGLIQYMEDAGYA